MYVYFARVPRRLSSVRARSERSKRCSLVKVPGGWITRLPCRCGSVTARSSLHTRAEPHFRSGFLPRYHAGKRLLAVSDLRVAAHRDDQTMGKMVKAGGQGFGSDNGKAFETPSQNRSPSRSNRP